MIHRTFSIIAACSALLFIVACNLTKDVEIELPEYTSQPVVECYIEPGKPFRLLLTQSFAFFDQINLDTSYLAKTLLPGALAEISYQGNVIALPGFITFESQPFKIFNYSSFTPAPYLPGEKFTLKIILADGKIITGETAMPTLVPIDSIVTDQNQNNGKFRVLTYITDDRNQTDYYRRILNFGSLDSIPEQDFTVSDRIVTSNTIAFGMGYDLLRKDTVFNSIYHISRDYYDYIESVQNAIISSFNPFSQPSAIKSNVHGTANPLGIFTCLVYDRDTTVVK